MCSLISEAWGMISADIVIGSFKNTGMSTVLDATGDHLVWDGYGASKADMR